MRYYLIVSHGTLAQGFLDTLGMIAGTPEHITAICAYVENISIESQVKDFFDRMTEDDEIVVFTDILGGSVNQFFITMLRRQHFHLITGINLAVVIAVIYIPEDGYIEEARIHDELERARNQMVYMNQYTGSVTVDDIEC